MKSAVAVTKEKIKKTPGLFAKGVAAPFRALVFVKENSGLKRYFIIPFIINLAVLTGIVLLCVYRIFPGIMDLLPQGDSIFVSILRWFVKPLIHIILLIVVVFIYSIIGSIITSPFNDPLSARVETIMTGVDNGGEFSLARFLGDIVRVLGNLIKLLIIVGIYQIIVFFIPVVGAVLSFLGTMFFFGFQFIEFPLERRRLSFREKLKICWKFKFTTIGIGLGFFLLTYVPILGFLALNLGTVAGTRMFVEHIKPIVDGK